MAEPRIVLTGPFETYRGGLLTPADVFVVSDIASIVRDGSGRITSVVIQLGGLAQTVTIGRDGSGRVTSVVATLPT